MPKVTEEHRAARRRQIMRAAWVCFARNGFHATSMADVIGESGLSAGAVYGYFRNKEDLIQQAAEATVGSIGDPVARDLAALDPPDLGRAVVIAVEHATSFLVEEGFDKSPVAVQAFGEALRSPALLALVHRAHSAIRTELTSVARRAQQQGLLAADADPEHVGAAMFGLLPGLLIQRAILGVDTQDYCDGIRALVGPPAHPAPPA
ncbi:TetR/AcrR family transcriptional regulator [Luteipulveratus sp. YIM 133132]|uniref:TetR/AcrR family transcriptional regulator n=1 Tax=Luteipulveratus flavus TaxID=3031728 RepID=UPI0023B10CE3|nr:TetR/AcrR family transcriptional regulator [Luteipulveratus sp. YIM 133132]MDE9366829.1 TetR/AcrR family transcriptional regulator [Luteipulveratus sp. YIM 133132]